MQKLIIKTAIVTLSAIFAGVIFVLSVLTVFAPKTLGNLNKNLGNEKLTVWYYELQYQKTDSIHDLEDLLFAVNEGGTTSQQVKYHKEMLNHPNFAVFCQNTDEKGVSTVSYKDYVAGNYSCALYLKGEKSLALETAKNYTTTYTDGNALSRLVSVAYQDKDFLTELKTAIETFDSENALVSSDLQFINSILSL